MAVNSEDDKTLTIAATNAGTGVSNIDVDASGVLALDGAGGINIGTAANVAVDFNASTLDVDASGAITLTGGAASNFTTGAGAFTLSGKTGVNIQENGATIIGISDARALSTTNTASIGFRCFWRSIN